MEFAYSDRINHAFAYAAVHHKDQVRKGSRVPYITHLANVALILSRYGCDDDTIIAGILHDVVEDCKEHSREAHCRGIRAKFGESVLSDVLAVTKPEVDEAGKPLSNLEKKSGYIAQVTTGSRRAMWVCAADKLHNASCIISDLSRSGGDDTTVWQRFKGTKQEAARFYLDVLDALAGSGFDEPIMKELKVAVVRLNTLAAEHAEMSRGTK